MPVAVTTSTSLQPIIDALRASLHRHFPTPTRIILAISGGADSTALLHAWHGLIEERTDDLIVAHFDHQLRPDSSRDADFVQRTTDRLGLPCIIGRPAHSLTENVGQSIETAARQARYQFLTDVARTHRASVVATAHVQGDQVESILHAIVRGAGLNGLAGMSPSRPLADGITLLRPLLDVSGSMLREVLRISDIEWRDDPTNEDTQFTRNWIRHELLPLLRDRCNPRVDDALLRLASSAHAVNQHVDADLRPRLEQAVLEQTPNSLRIAPAPLLELEERMIGECWRRLWEQTGWPRGRIGADHLQRLVDLTIGRGPIAWDLPAGVHARRWLRPLSILLTRNGGMTDE